MSQDLHIHHCPLAEASKLVTPAFLDNGSLPCPYTPDLHPQTPSWILNSTLLAAYTPVIISPLDFGSGLLTGLGAVHADCCSSVVSQTFFSAPLSPGTG